MNLVAARSTCAAFASECEVMLTKGRARTATRTFPCARVACARSSAVTQFHSQVFGVRSSAVKALFLCADAATEKIRCVSKCCVIVVQISGGKEHSGQTDLPLLRVAVTSSTIPLLVHSHVNCRRHSYFRRCLRRGAHPNFFEPWSWDRSKLLPEPAQSPPTIVGPWLHPACVRIQPHRPAVGRAEQCHRALPHRTVSAAEGERGGRVGNC